MTIKPHVFRIGLLAVTFLLAPGWTGRAQELNTAQILIRDVILGEGGTPVIDPGSGNALVSQGSWTKPGGNYRDPLSNIRPSDHDLRCLVPAGVNNAEAIQIYNQTRARVASRVRARFGANADKVLESINIYPPEQLMAGVTSEAEAIERFSQLGIGTPNLGGAAPEGLWTAGRFQFARAYERTSGRIFFNNGTRMQAGFADIVSDVATGMDDAVAHTLQGASQNAAAFAEKVAHAVADGKPEDAIKNLKRTRTYLGKSYGLAQAEGSASYLDDLIARAQADPFPLLNPSLRQEILAATRKASLEARLLENLKTGCSAADKELITTWLKELNGHTSIGQKILNVFSEVPLDKIGIGLQAVFSFYQGYVIGAKIDEGDVEGALREAGVWVIFEGIGLGPGMMVMMANLLIDQAKEFGYDLVASTQDCEDLLAGVFTVRGREVNVLDDKVQPLTVDDLVTMYQRPEDLAKAIDFRAHHAAGRGLGVATGRSDAEVEKRLRECCGKEVLVKWTLKRNELDREFAALHSALAAAPVAISVQPDPAVFKPDEAPYRLRALFSSVADIKRTERRMEQILTKLAGKSQYAVMIHHEWQLDGVTLTNDADRAAISFEVDKGGPHTLYGQMTLKIASGQYYGRSFPDLKLYHMTTVDVIVKTNTTAGETAAPVGTTTPTKPGKPSESPDKVLNPGKYLSNLRWTPTPISTKCKTLFRLDVKNAPKGAKYCWYFGKEPKGVMGSDAMTDQPELLQSIEKAGRQTLSVKLFDTDAPDAIVADQGLDTIAAEFDAVDEPLKIEAPAQVIAGDHFNVTLPLSPELASQIGEYEWVMVAMRSDAPGGVISGGGKLWHRTTSPVVTLQADPAHVGLKIKVSASLTDQKKLPMGAAQSGLIDVQKPDILASAPAGWKREDKGAYISFSREPVERKFPPATKGGSTSSARVVSYVSINMYKREEKMNFQGTPIANGKYGGALDHVKKVGNGRYEYYSVDGGMQYDEAIVRMGGHVEGRADAWSDEAMAFSLAESGRADEEMMQILTGVKVTPHEKYTNATQKLAVKLTANKTALGHGETATVRALVTGGEGACTYQWTGNHGAGSDPSVVEFATATPGEHRLSVTVTDAKGNTASADIKLALALYTATIQMSGGGDKIVLGDTRGFHASVKFGDREVGSGIEYQWQPHPEVTFEPFAGPEGRTTAKFTKPGPVKVWVQLLQNQEGKMTTVGESEPIELEVVEPVLKVLAEPMDPLIGREVRAWIEPQEGIDGSSLSYAWELKGAARNAGASADEQEYSFVTKDKSPVTLIVRGKAKEGGADMGQAEVTITPKAYDVTISAPHLLGPPPQVWDPKKGGLVEVPQAIGVYRDFQVKVSVSPAPAETSALRYQWIVSPDGCIVMSPHSQETRCNAKQPGSFTLKATVRDADGAELGSGTHAFSVVEAMDAGAIRQASAKLDEAKGLYRQGKLDEAINLCQSASTMNAKDAQAQQLLANWSAERQTILQQIGKAQTAAKANQFTEAFNAIGEARKLHPGYAPVLQAEIELQDLKVKYDASNKPSQPTNTTAALQSSSAKETPDGTTPGSTGTSGKSLQDTMKPSTLVGTTKPQTTTTAGTQPPTQPSASGQSAQQPGAVKSPSAPPAGPATGTTANQPQLAKPARAPQAEAPEPAEEPAHEEEVKQPAQPTVPSGVSLEILTPKVVSGDVLKVRIQNPPKEKHAWIGFYRKGADSRDYIKYTFLNNLDNNTYEDILAPDDEGEYDFRVFRDESFTPVAVSATIRVGR